jgi:hypothetical protein
MHRLRKRPSAAMVVASLALLLALGGTSFAAAKLVVPRRSVGALQLKVNSVNSSKVLNHSLLRIDFKTGQIPAGPAGPQGPKGDTGSAGSQGPQGLRGDTGATGAGGGFDPTKLHVQSFGSVNVSAASYGGSDYTCPAGQYALSGGFNSGYRFELEYVGPINTTTWRVRLYNPTGGTESFQAELVCYG